MASKAQSERADAQAAIAAQKEEDLDQLSDKSSTYESAPAYQPPRVLDKFWILPRERRTHILVLACGQPRVHHTQNPGHSDDCTKTMHRLSLTSRSFYAEAMPLLYAHIRLWRPSDLRLLLNTLMTRPALGQLVKSIHIGSVDSLRPNWFPVSGYNRHTFLYIAMIDRPLEEIDRPGWVCPTTGFSLSEPGRDGSRKAISEAIEAASQDLDADANRPLLSHLGVNIGANAWHVRIMELQAALELYLGEMGRRDRKQKETTPNHSYFDPPPPYPRLVIETDPAAADTRQHLSEDVFHLSRSQILDYIARRRSRTDRFDHPILFARSGMPWRYESRGHDFHNSDVAPLQDGDEGGGLQADDLAPRQAAPQAHTADVSDAGVVMPFSGLTHPLDRALHSCSTLGGIANLTRVLLVFTPHVESLNLTGFLERIMCGSRSPPALSALRSLSVGPPPELWHNSLRLNHAALSAVERLRICGRELSRSELSSVLGEGGAFPKLTSFQWSLPSRFTACHMSLTDTILRSTDSYGAAISSAHDTSAQSRKRARPNEGNDQAGRCSDLPLYVDIRLHNLDAAEILSAAPSDKVREAWQTGSLVQGSSVRLKVSAYPPMRTTSIKPLGELRGRFAIWKKRVGSGGRWGQGVRKE